MELKKYQARTLKILSDFLTDAKIIGNEKAFEKYQDAQGYNPDYPMIKCNVNDYNDKIYHLPFDQMYDKIDMSKPKAFYVGTVEEAEREGFRRAKRWMG